MPPPPPPPNPIVIVGCTASGKSDLGEALAERLHARIMAVDSMQVYRGMDIGTAKPDAATRARIPHAMIDVADPWESYSAALASSPTPAPSSNPLAAAPSSSSPAPSCTSAPSWKASSKAPALTKPSAPN